MSSGETATRTVELLPARSPAAGAMVGTRAASGDALLWRLRLFVAATIGAMIALAALRVWFVEGVMVRATVAGPSLAPALPGAAYEVTCAECQFTFLCDAEHEPAERRAACPNCGWTANDLAGARLLPPARVVIDRWPLLFRGPRRHEVVACDIPGEAGALAVKRVASLPAEQPAIRHGDLYVNGRIVRKTLADWRQLRLLVHDNDFLPRVTTTLPPRWRASNQPTAWQAAPGGFQLPAEAQRAAWDWLQYEHWSCTADAKQRGIAAAVRDNDSFNQGETRRPLNVVPDVMLSCRIQSSGAGELALAAADGQRRLAVVIQPDRGIRVQSGEQVVQELRADVDFSGAGGDLEFGLCDQQLLLAVRGRTIVRWAYERDAGPPNETLHPLAIGGRGLSLKITKLQAWRDVYYLDPQGLDRGWDAPLAGGSNGIGLLGDNAPVSIDSRHWEPALVPRAAVRGLVYRPFWARVGFRSADAGPFAARKATIPAGDDARAAK